MAQSHNIPSMTPPVVHDFLRDIGRAWTGQGTAMELGCWLGASSRPLLEGLVEAGYDRPFWAFDRWEAQGSEMRKAKEQGEILTPGQDLIDLYLHNVTPVYGNINAFRGRIPGTLNKYDGSPIEICIFDAPKQNPVFRRSINYVLPRFIPGVTILGLLDYYQYRKFDKGEPKRKRLMAPVNFIKAHEQNFTMLKQWPEVCACVFFKYVKKLKT